MGWNDDCDGAICCYSNSIALFESRKEARTAIRISAAFARLGVEQKKWAVEDCDFIGPCAKHIKIVALKPAAKKVKP